MEPPQKPCELFRLPNPYRDPVRRRVFALANHTAEKLLGLPECGRLYQKIGPLETPAIFAARAPEVLREITFRAAGEGSGSERDLDAFDGHYGHVVLWNRQQGEVVGAYRLGRTDQVLSRFGRKGLYTSTLFRLRAPFLARLGPALEMGRSFVRPEYQRSCSPSISTATSAMWSTA